jgi:hypothetical protein
MSDVAAPLILLINGPSPYYCQTDEDHFFGWLQSIPAIKAVKGTPSGLELTVQRPIDSDSLRDLIALLTRYSVDCRPLKPLCDEQQDEYFRAKGKYWHAAVYG